MHRLVPLNRRIPPGVLVMLERSAGKLARCVLRGPDGCEPTWLPDGNGKWLQLFVMMKVEKW
jgi:hypothetical protein